MVQLSWLGVRNVSGSVLNEVYTLPPHTWIRNWMLVLSLYKGANHFDISVPRSIAYKMAEPRSKPRVCGYCVTLKSSSHSMYFLGSVTHACSFNIRGYTHGKCCAWWNELLNPCLQLSFQLNSRSVFPSTYKISSKTSHQYLELKICPIEFTPCQLLLLYYKHFIVFLLTSQKPGS